MKRFVAMVLILTWIVGLVPACAVVDPSDKAQVRNALEAQSVEERRGVEQAALITRLQILFEQYDEDAVFGEFQCDEEKYNLPLTRWRLLKYLEQLGPTDEFKTLLQRVQYGEYAEDLPCTLELSPLGEDLKAEAEERFKLHRIAMQEGKITEITVTLLIGGVITATTLSEVILAVLCALDVRDYCDASTSVASSGSGSFTSASSSGDYAGGSP